MPIRKFFTFRKDVPSAPVGFRKGLGYYARKVLRKPSQRDLVVAFARWGVKHEPDIHYAETRPIPLGPPGQLPGLPFTTDCSGFATIAYRYAGTPDPNGQGYDGSGYTGTLLDHGQHVTAPLPGDLVVYGGGTGHHVAVVVEAGSDPLTVSHGGEKGPLLITVSEERKYQPPGITFLRFLP